MTVDFIFTMAHSDQADGPNVNVTSEADLLLPGGTAILTTQNSIVHPQYQTDEAPSAASSGVLLEKKYRLEEELGQGGMGTVFRATDEALNRTVAVKFLHSSFRKDPKSVAVFRKEAQALASVRHENVVQIYAFGKHGDTDFFVMEYVSGETLKAILRAKRASDRLIPLVDALHILDQACSGLAAIHDAGLVHRDINPANIMLEAHSKRVVIMDFGLGRGRKSDQDPRRVKIAGGTPGYIAPEAICARELEGWEEFLADIYSFGVTAYELLTGRPPFEAENRQHLLHQHLTKTPIPPSQFRKDLPKGLDEVLLQCMEKKPIDRFQWCDELRGALQPFLRMPLTKSIVSVTPTSSALQTDDCSRPTMSELDSGPRVLVAGEDQELRNTAYSAARSVLPESHFRAARSTLSALESVRTRPPSVLIASLHDKSFNGLELAATIFGDDSLRGVKLILTAREFDPADRVLLERLGVFRLLTEPLDVTSLEAVFREIGEEIGGGNPIVSM